MFFIAHYVDGFYLINKGNGTSWFYNPLNRWAENWVNTLADVIIVNEQKKVQFEKHFKPHLGKVNFVTESPNTLPETQVNLKNPRFRPFLFFAGTLYMDIRNPEHTLKLMGQLADFDFVIAGNLNDCESMVQRYVEECENIFYIGMLGADELKQHYASCACLVNIDNSDLNQQAPGKIFEYMLYNKPILNFYKKESLSGVLLKKYSQTENSFFEVHGDDEISQQFIDGLKLENSKSLFSYKNNYDELYAIYNQELRDGPRS